MSLGIGGAGGGSQLHFNSAASSALACNQQAGLRPLSYGTPSLASSAFPQSFVSAASGHSVHSGQSAAFTSCEAAAGYPGRPSFLPSSSGAAPTAAGSLGRPAFLPNNSSIPEAGASGCGPLMSPQQARPRGMSHLLPPTAAAAAAAAARKAAAGGPPTAGSPSGVAHLGQGGSACLQPSASRAAGSLSVPPSSARSPPLLQVAFSGLTGFGGGGREDANATAANSNAVVGGVAGSSVAPVCGARGASRSARGDARFQEYVRYRDSLQSGGCQAAAASKGKGAGGYGGKGGHGGKGCRGQRAVSTAAGLGQPRSSLRQAGSKSPVEPGARIGVDIGGVLTQTNSDFKNAGNWEDKVQWASNGAFEGLRRLVQIFGAENVFLVSKVNIGGSMHQRVEHWLHNTCGICQRTGLLRENIFFTNSKTGYDGKGVVAGRLGLSHFIDDSFEVLESVFEDPCGNSGNEIRAKRGKLFHFASGGTGLRLPDVDVDHVPRHMRPYYCSVISWPNLLQHFNCFSDAENTQKAKVCRDYVHAVMTNMSD